jgi:hypothetical protein
MAIDTATKRKSALGQRWSRLPFGRRFIQPTPDGTIDQADRQTLGGIYGGILVGELIVVVPPITNFTIDIVYSETLPTLNFIFAGSFTVDY